MATARFRDLLAVVARAADAGMGMPDDRGVANAGPGLLPSASAEAAVPNRDVALASRL